MGVSGLAGHADTEEAATLFQEPEPEAVEHEQGVDVGGPAETGTRLRLAELGAAQDWSAAAAAAAEENAEDEEGEGASPGGTRADGQRSQRPSTTRRGGGRGDVDTERRRKSELIGGGDVSLGELNEALGGEVTTDFTWGSGRGLHSSTSQLNLSRVCHKETPYTP